MQLKYYVQLKVPLQRKQLFDIIIENRSTYGRCCVSQWNTNTDNNNKSNSRSIDDNDSVNDVDDEHRAPLGYWR